MSKGFFFLFILLLLSCAILIPLAVMDKRDSQSVYLITYQNGKVEQIIEPTLKLNSNGCVISGYNTVIRCGVQQIDKIQ